MIVLPFYAKTVQELKDFAPWFADTKHDSAKTTMGHVTVHELSQSILLTAHRYKRYKLDSTVNTTSFLSVCR